MGLFDRAYPEAALREELTRQQLEELRAQRGLLGQQRQARGKLLAQAPEYINAPSQTAMLGQEVFGMGRPQAEAMYGSELYAQQMRRGQPFAQQNFENDPQTLALRASPETMLPKYMANMGPRAPLAPTVVGDKQRLVGGDPLNPTVLVNSTPDSPEPFKPTNMQKPGTNDVRLARTQQDYDGLASQGFAQAGNSVPGAAPPKDPEKPDYSRLDYWRGQVKPELTAANEARLSYDKINNAIDSGASLGTAIQLIQKMIDEKGVVRGEDVEIFQKNQSVLDSLAQEYQTRSDGQLTDTSKTKLRTLAKSLAKTRLDAFKSNFDATKPMIRSEKVDPSMVVPGEILSRFTFDENPAPTKPPGPPPIGKNGRPMKWVPE